MDTIRREYVSLWSWAAERQERQQIATMLDTVGALSDVQLPDESPELIDDLLAGFDPSATGELSLDSGQAA
jgi:uncharacterized membrane protein (UPF0127 family)